MRSIIPFLIIPAIVFSCAVTISMADDGWYSEGNNAHKTRIKITLINSLDFDREDCPVVIARNEMPIKNLHEMWVTIVDPGLPPKQKPSKEELAFVGGHGIREEANGHQIF